MTSKRRVLLVQLPIPPVGHEPVRGNVPLAAGYLKLMARERGLESRYDIEIFPPRAVNTLGDRGLVNAILARRPWLVGFTCYLWNIDRTLWIADQLKRADPEIKVLLGGPEITADNAWVLEQESIDFAAVGEGEQTFCELLAELNTRSCIERTVDGLFVRSAEPRAPVPFRRPLARLDEISSPYLAGILDAADEQMLLLETVRGCVFKCKFCYYPKSYDSLYFLSPGKISANLEHARRRGAREVVLLDPTLNQRPDFAGLLRLLIDGNPDGQFTYFGELRAEGITPQLARLCRDANFTEVEIGLQSVDPAAQELMDRKNNLKAFERGIKALIDVGIEVKVDLIIGLPGDTVDSVRRGLDYLCSSRLYSSMQVFNLAVLPGTAFRQEADQLGLKYQPRPPYYVLGTPTLGLEEMYALMHEAQERLGIEYDPLSAPKLEFDEDGQAVQVIRVDLNRDDGLPGCLPPASARTQALTLWLRSDDFHRDRQRAAVLVERLLADCPFTTLQVVLEPTADPRMLSLVALDCLARACFSRPTYLDRFYAVQPGRPKAAKRLVALVPFSRRIGLTDWAREAGDVATIVWRGAGEPEPSLEEYEYVA
ncbi:MAG TPA: radical SAM protein [Pirellulales bacterium]|nr:radical SAM protein [Pirellulales bacterium]